MSQLYPQAPRRTLATAAGMEAVFAFAWFGWGQASPPFAVSIVLAAGSVLAALVTAFSAVTAHRLRTEPSPLEGPAAARRYGIIVGVEFATAATGAVALGAAGVSHLIPAWICLVVGVHFVPLGKLFPGTGMTPLAAAITLVGGAAFAAVGAGVPPSTVTGLGAGLCLLAHAASMLLTARRRLRGFGPEDPASLGRAPKVLYSPPAARPRRTPAPAGSRGTPASRHLTGASRQRQRTDGDHMHTTDPLTSDIRLGVARGIQYGLINKPDQFAARAENLGARLLRVFLYWSQIEPQPGRYDFTAVDAILDQADPDTELWLMIGASSPWGSSRPVDFLPASTPVDMAAYARMVETLVTHCAGRVRWWQCENEPSNPMFWAGTVTDYIAQLRCFAAAVRAADPAAQVVLGGCPPGVYPGANNNLERDFYQRLITDAADAFDAFDIHLYGDPYQIPATVNDIRESMRDAGSRKPILAGESNGPLPIQYPEAMAELGDVLASGGAKPWQRLTAERFRAGELSAPLARAAMRRLYDRMAELPASLQMFMSDSPAETQATWHRVNARDIAVRQTITLAAGITRSVCWQIFPDEATDPDPYEFLRLMFSKFNLLPHEPGRTYPAGDAFAALASHLHGIDQVRRVDLPDQTDIFLYELARSNRVAGRVAWLRHDRMDDEPAPRPVDGYDLTATANPTFTRIPKTASARR